MFLLLLGLVALGICYWLYKIKKQGEQEREIFYFSETKFKELNISLSGLANKHVNKNSKIFDRIKWSEKSDKYIKDILKSLVIIKSLAEALYSESSKIGNTTLGNQKWGDLDLVAGKAKFNIFWALETNDETIILSNLACINKSIHTFYNEVWPSRPVSFAEANFRINILAYALGQASASMGLLQSDLKRNSNLSVEDGGCFKLNGGFIS